MILICGPKWRLKWPRNIRPPPWKLDIIVCYTHNNTVLQLAPPSRAQPTCRCRATTLITGQRLLSTVTLAMLLPRKSLRMRSRSPLAVNQGESGMLVACLPVKVNCMVGLFRKCVIQSLRGTLEEMQHRRTYSFLHMYTCMNICHIMWQCMHVHTFNTHTHTHSQAHACMHRGRVMHAHVIMYTQQHA